MNVVGGGGFLCYLVNHRPIHILDISLVPLTFLVSYSICNHVGLGSTSAFIAYVFDTPFATPKNSPSDSPTDCPSDSPPFCSASDM